MKKVLVTGATGFIGRHTLEPLLAKGYEVHATYHTRPSNDIENVYWHKANLLMSDDVFRLMHQVRPTHLLHFAWYVEHGKFWNAPENWDWLNASQYLINEFELCGGKRVVCAGTCAEYDWTSLTANSICDELHTPLIPITQYGKSKYAFYKFIESKKLNFAWGRIFFPYGPGEPAKKLVASVILALLRDEVAKTTHGQQIRDFMYVKDVADAFVALLDCNVQGAINIGSGLPIILRQVIETISDSLDKKDQVEFGTLPSLANDPIALVANPTRLQDETTWKPKYSVRQGIVETIEWWKKHENIH